MNTNFFIAPAPRRNLHPTDQGAAARAIDDQRFVVTGEKVAAELLPPVES